MKDAVLETRAAKEGLKMLAKGHPLPVVLQRLTVVSRAKRADVETFEAYARARYGELLDETCTLTTAERVAAMRRIDAGVDSVAQASLAATQAAPATLQHDLPAGPAPAPLIQTASPAHSLPWVLFREMLADTDVAEASCEPASSITSLVVDALHSLHSALAHELGAPLAGARDIFSASVATSLALEAARRAAVPDADLPNFLTIPAEPLRLATAALQASLDVLVAARTPTLWVLPVYAASPRLEAAWGLLLLPGSDGGRYSLVVLAAHGISGLSAYAFGPSPLVLSSALRYDELPFARLASPSFLQAVVLHAALPVSAANPRALLPEVLVPFLRTGAWSGEHISLAATACLPPPTVLSPLGPSLVRLMCVVALPTALALAGVPLELRCALHVALGLRLARAALPSTDAATTEAGLTGLARAACALGPPHGQALRAAVYALLGEHPSNYVSPGQAAYDVESVRDTRCWRLADDADAIDRWPGWRLPEASLTLLCKLAHDGPPGDEVGAQQLLREVAYKAEQIGRAHV